MTASLIASACAMNVSVMTISVILYQPQPQLLNAPQSHTFRAAARPTRTHLCTERLHSNALGISVSPSPPLSRPSCRLRPPIIYEAGQDGRLTAVDETESAATVSVMAASVMTRYGGPGSPSAGRVIDSPPRPRQAVAAAVERARDGSGRLGQVRAGPGTQSLRTTAW
jgi:hypothetical protein